MMYTFTYNVLFVCIRQLFLSKTMKIFCVFVIKIVFLQNDEILTLNIF